MLKVIVNGYGGMGKVLIETAGAFSDIEIVAICDPGKGMSRLEDIDVSADVIVDFSVTDAIEQVIEYCKRNKMPAVLAVTGYSPEQEKLINELAMSVPVFRAKNMSAGMYIISKVVKELADFCSWDVEIIEKHHKRKKDMPSGTAVMLKEALGKEVHIHSVRAGTIAGEHSVIFAGDDEIIEVRHTALSKRIFAQGAIKAAYYISKAAPGLYDMGDIL